MPLYRPGGYQRLAATRLSGSAVTTGAIAIPARDLLLVQIHVTGYSGGGDIASLRFNADSAGNYTSKYASSASAATTWTVAAAQTAQTLARLFATAVTTGRSAVVGITNRSGSEKIGTVDAVTGLGGTGTGPTIQQGGFTWVNTSAQITSIEMRTAGGSVTMDAGSGFTVFGVNLS